MIRLIRLIRLPWQPGDVTPVSVLSAYGKVPNCAELKRAGPVRFMLLLPAVNVNRIMCLNEETRYLTHCACPLSGACLV